MVYTNRDFRIVQMQAAVFTPGHQLSGRRVLVTMLQRWGELFDGDPFALPTAALNGMPLRPPRQHLALQAWRKVPY